MTREEVGEVRVEAEVVTEEAEVEVEKEAEEEETKVTGVGEEGEKVEEAEEEEKGVKEELEVLEEEAFHETPRAGAGEEGEEGEEEALLQLSQADQQVMFGHFEFNQETMLQYYYNASGGLGGRKGAEKDWEDGDWDVPVAEPPKALEETEEAAQEKFKVEMQRLHMSEENQELLKAALLEVRGELRLRKEKSYKDQGRRLDHGYWLKDNQLLVRGVQDFSEERVVHPSGNRTTIIIIASTIILKSLTYFLPRA